MTGEAATQIVTEALGWAGCALLIVSILQRRILALRVLSLISSLILTAYNLVHGVWPMVAMNAAIVVINAVYLARANRKKVSHAQL
jgi:cell division protein FtsB